MKAITGHKDAPIGSTVMYTGSAGQYKGKIGKVVAHKTKREWNYWSRSNTESPQLEVNFNGTNKVYACSSFVLADAASTPVDTISLENTSQKYLVVNADGMGFVGNSVDEAARKCKNAGGIHANQMKAYTVKFLGSVGEETRVVYSVK